MRRLAYVTLTTLALTFPAAAAGIDFTTPITQVGGKPFTDGAGKPTEITLGSVCEQALLADYPDEKDATGKSMITPEEKVHRWRLATRIDGNKSADLSAEEVALLKKLVGKGFPASVVGPAWSILDPGAK